MGTGYTRQSEAEITDGEVIFAAPIEAELDAIQAAFNATTGHSHDGTAGEGPKISLTTSVAGVLPKANGGSGVNTDNLVTAGGTANAITITANEAFVSLTSGKQVFFRALANNTNAVTINVNGLGAKDAVKFDPTGELPLDPDDIVEGNIYLITYDSTLDGGTGGWNVMNVANANHSHNGDPGQGPQIDLTEGVSGILPRANGGTAAATDAMVTSGGTANALTITANEPFASLTSGKEVIFRASLSNTAAATVNVNSLGIKDIVKFNPDTGEVALSSQDIVIGEFHKITYNSTLDGGSGAWVLMNPRGVLNRITPIAQTNVTIQQLTGDFAALNLNSILGTTRTALYWDSTDGKAYLAVYDSSGVLVGDPLEFDGSLLTIGSWNSGQTDSFALLKNSTATPISLAVPLVENTWTTWPITTEVYDDDGIVSISANQFTMARDAMVRWEGMIVGASSGAGANNFSYRTRLQNITDGSTVEMGTIVEYASADSMTVGMWSPGEAEVVSGKTYAIQYYVSTTNGLSIASHFAQSFASWGDQINLRVKLHAPRS